MREENQMKNEYIILKASSKIFEGHCYRMSQIQIVLEI